MYIKNIFYATYITLSLSIYSMLLGLLISIFINFIYIFSTKNIKLLINIIINFIKWLPEILIIFIIYFGSFKFSYYFYKKIDINIFFTKISFNFNIENIFNSFICSIIALSIIYTSYVFQIINFSIYSISKQQWESGEALGLNKTTIFKKIILPQIWNLALPGLFKQWLILIKDTSLVSLIGVNDLLFQINNIIYLTQKPFLWYFIALLIYLFITIISIFIFKIIKIKII